MDSPLGPERTVSIQPDTLALKEKAQMEGIATVWDRHQAQEPQCGFCSLGLSCRICVMGPCRIDPFGEGPQQGVCAADADIMVARNLGRMIAAGAASHSDHGRDLVETLLAVAEGRSPGYQLTDLAKLDRLATEFGVAADLPPLAMAEELAYALMEEYGIRNGHLTFTKRLPAARLEKWRALNLAPRGIDWEVTEMLHRTHMGVDNDYVNLLLQALRCALADGWGGSMIATEISDVLFGTPTPRASQVNIGVLKKDQVNIILHGHSPLVSEMVARAAQDPGLVGRAQELGAAGINLAGLCCTGNEVLMLKGIPMAGNHLVQELALVTGAVEAMVVDYQCIMPAVAELASCYHTRFFTTSPKAKFPKAKHFDFTPENGRPARSARDAPVSWIDLVGTARGAVVLQTPSRAKSATSQFGPTEKLRSMASASAISTRQCCHSFTGIHKEPFTAPLTVQVGESVPDISVSPPVPATLGSTNPMTSGLSVMPATPAGMPSKESLIKSRPQAPPDTCKKVEP